MIFKALPGTIVQVRPPADILATLDETGGCEGLPFMPEMVDLCGQKFEIARRVSKICCERPQMEMRSFPGDDVVILRGLRCSGRDYDGCQNGCYVFWKLTWLQLPTSTEQAISEQDRQTLRSRLRTRDQSGRYCCQATTLAGATELLSAVGRIKKCFADLCYRSYSPLRMAGLIMGPLIRKLHRRKRGEWPRGSQSRTPVDSLNLQPGEWVEVKPLAEIEQTLDANGKNRGLHFSEDMVAFCGKRLRVRNRLDRMMHESAGRLHEVRHTVILENVTCQCPFTFGGCSRSQFQYWREIWLRRVPNESASH